MMRGANITNARWFFIGLFNVVVTLLVMFGFFYQPPAPVVGQLNFLGINAGGVVIGGIAFEHEFAFMGIFLFGLFAFSPPLMLVGLIGYLTDFNNLFNYPFGLADFASNPVGSFLSLGIGLWIGLNLYFIARPLEAGKVQAPSL